jgi:uncharacterized protein (DUF1778 family)
VLRLDGTAFDELKRALDAPAEAPAALARLMGRRPVWEAAAES